jgi:hypothetical protein
VDKLLAAKTRDEYKPPAELMPGFPEAIATLIAACLKHEREARPKNAVQLLAILENIRV